MRLILCSRIDEARRSLLVEFVETYVPLMGNDFIEFQELIHTENQYEEVEKMVTVYEQMGMEQETWIEGYSGCVHREVSEFHLFPNFDEVNWSENSH